MIADAIEEDTSYTCPLKLIALLDGIYSFPPFVLVDTHPLVILPALNMLGLDPASYQI
jgi:hypothetical protein